MKKFVLLSLLCCASLRALGGISDSLESLPPLRFDGDLSARVEGPKLYFRPKVDFAIIIPATAWAIFAFPKIYDKPNIDTATIKALNKDNVPAFDRWAVRSSDAADAASNIPFYASIPYPLVLLADKDIRHDAGRVYGLYWEAMAITGLLYTGGDYFIDRYRPEVYDESKPVNERTERQWEECVFRGPPGAGEYRYIFHGLYLRYVSPNLKAEVGILRRSGGSYRHYRLPAARSRQALAVRPADRHSNWRRQRDAGTAAAPEQAS